MPAVESLPLGIIAPVTTVRSHPCLAIAARSAVGPPSGSHQQLPRIHLQHPRDPLQALQGQVPLATLYPAHVGAVDAEDVGEGFLAEAPFVTVGAEVPPYGLLEIAFRHAVETGWVLLVSLQTYK